MKYRRMDPRKGYRGDYLWLPLEHVPNRAGIQASLTFPLSDKAPVCAWGTTSTHLVVPRAFIPPSDEDQYDFEIVDIRPKRFPQVEIGPLTYDLRGPIQRMGYASMVDEGDGVLALLPGKGKTVVAIHAMAALGMPALVVVHTKDLLYQWITRLTEHASLEREDIGIVQGTTMDWEKPVTLAMIQTLAAKYDDLPVEMRNHFGIAVYDEVHHLGAPWFNTTAPLCGGVRWGLSGTPLRADGLDRLYMAHIGGVLFESMQADIVPEVFFVKTDINPTKEDLASMSTSSGANLAKLYNWLADCDERNDIICNMLWGAVQDGRKPLVLSERVNHLKFMASFQWPTPHGLIYGGVKGEAREEILQSYDLVFATTPLAKEGLDRKDLDTIFICMPFVDEGRLRQIIGRIQRKCAGKKPPVVVVIYDNLIPSARNMCNKLMHHLAGFQYPYAVQERPAV